MDYAEWIQEQYGRGVPVERIAEAALKGPVMLPGGAVRVAPLLQQVAAALHVVPTDVHIVGSSRYGFSLRDGAEFDPAFSDLDLAVVNARLHARCADPSHTSLMAVRFPETDLPAGERTAVRKAFDDLSRSVANHFAYVSVAVFPDLWALVQAQAGRISNYLGIRAEGAASPAPVDAPLQAVDAGLRTIAKEGLPQFALPVAASTPANASPWLASTTSFAAVFGGSGVRRSRLDALERAFQDLSQVIDVQCSLVGGSFVDVSNPTPNDLDIVVFYRGIPDIRFDIGRALRRLTRKFLLERIDMRFVPCDAEPWLLVKLTSFFTTLYQTQRPGSEGRSRGLVLLVPDVPGKDSEPAASDGSCDGRKHND